MSRDKNRLFLEYLLILRLIYLLLAFFVFFLSPRATIIPIIAAQACWFCECCYPPWESCQKATRCGAYGPVSSPSACGSVCSSVGMKYCGDTPCPEDECQVDSDCGPGCRWLAGTPNYCYCPPTPTPPPNQNPTCTISASNITYDGMAYVDLTSGIPQTRAPTTHTGTISTSDPDGDSVTITSFTASGDCVAIARSGTTFTYTPQGHVTGRVPTLTGPTYCDVTFTAKVSDGKGGTGTCEKTIRVSYPGPQLYALRLVDGNDVVYPASGEDEPPNMRTDEQFTAVGGVAPEPFTTTGARLQDAGLPTRRLRPVGQRFVVGGYTASDHNLLQVMLYVWDENGVLDGSGLVPEGRRVSLP